MWKKQELHVQWNLVIRDTHGTVKNCPEFWGGVISQVHFYVMNRPRDWSSCDLNSQVVPISQVVLNTDFTVFEISVTKEWSAAKTTPKVPNISRWWGCITREHNWVKISDLSSLRFGSYQKKFGFIWAWFSLVLYIHCLTSVRQPDNIPIAVICCCFACPWKRISGYHLHTSGVRHNSMCFAERHGIHMVKGRGFDTVACKTERRTKGFWWSNPL